MRALDLIRVRRPPGGASVRNGSGSRVPATRWSLLTWTAILEFLWVTPLLIVRARPSVVVISALAAMIVARLVWGLLPSKAMDASRSHRAPDRSSVSEEPTREE